MASKRCAATVIVYVKKGYAVGLLSTDYRLYRTEYVCNASPLPLALLPALLSPRPSLVSPVPSPLICYYYTANILRRAHYSWHKANLLFQKFTSLPNRSVVCVFAHRHDQFEAKYALPGKCMKQLIIAIRVASRMRQDSLSACMARKISLAADTNMRMSYSFLIEKLQRILLVTKDTIHKRKHRHTPTYRFWV